MTRRRGGGGGVGGGVLPYRSYISIWLCAAPSGGFFVPFWSEIGYSFRGLRDRMNVFIASIPNE